MSNKIQYVNTIIGRIVTDKATFSRWFVVGAVANNDILLVDQLLCKSMYDEYVIKYFWADSLDITMQWVQLS